MKTTTTACAALLASAREIYMAELYTLTLRDGAVTRWAAADVAVSYLGNTWAPGPIIERDSIKSQMGLQVATVGVTMHADSTITAAWRGVLDGASMLIEKAFTDTPGGSIAGTVHLYEGRVADIEVNSTSIKLSIKDFVELLDTPVPLDVYQAGCVHSLYDSGCGVNKAANGLGLSVQAGTAVSLIKCAVTGAGVYDLGELLFTSGVNAGVRRAVKAHTAGQLLLSFPLLDLPAAGDTFTVYKGCDKKASTCQSKFGNQAKFKGFPFVPAPETAV
jgi:uncharacterized phage protein (TIGR02218 family)